ncbi:BCS1 N terminal-domain-containing protein [Mucidula mucida]|nr:BCS1 N terminal-domain-containing protein [Mucidula mucida]
MGLGFAVTYLSKFAQLGTSALQRRLLVKLELKNTDPSYHWFLSWMAAQQRQTGSTTVRWARSHELSVATVGHDEKGGPVTFNLVAGQGNHYFKYKRAWIKMTKERETRAVNLSTGEPWETISLTTLSRDRHIFPTMLTEARSVALQQQHNKLIINTTWGTDWKPFGNPRPRRPLSSVILAPGQAERIYSDVKSFMDRRQWYAERGIPYRRGYLLHGPPGTGKTSFIQALAGAFNYDISVINLSTRGMGDDLFALLLAKAPPKTFLLIEDLDGAFNKRVQTSSDGYQSSVTFSGVLNALDGVTSGEERILFMTTNHIERLDPALIRPGRAYNLCIFSMEKTSRNSGGTWQAYMADLQGLFILTEAKDVLAACRGLYQTKYSMQL